jgi:hypothetical protein
VTRWTRRLLGLTLLALVLGLFATLVNAQAPSPNGNPTAPGDLRSPQEQNADLFRKFQRELLFLAQKLEKSDKPEDKERAKVILAALELAKKENVDTQFQKMIAGLGKAGTNLQQLDSIAGQDKQLQKALQDILTVLMTDDSATQLKTERERLEKILAEAREVLRNQKTIRAMTDVKRVDEKRIAKDQENVTERTKDIAKKLGGEQKNGKETPEAVAKSEPKSESKDGETASEAKKDTNENKSEAKPGDSPAGEPMKPSDPMSGEGKPAAGPKDDKTKSAQEKPEAKPGDNAAKPKDAPKDPKDESKPADAKGQSQGKGQDKPSPAKPGEKPADGKGMEAKPGQDSPPQASAKPASSPPPQSGPQPPQSAQQQQQQAQQQPGRKQIEEALPHQQGSQKDLDKNQRDSAGKKQEKAIEELTKAVQELEKRIKQLREEETQKLLATLEARCKMMLNMQIDVYEATKVIHGTLVKNGGNKSNVEVQKSQQQADRELEIIAEAEKTLKLLESEGSAVAFARVLEEVRIDMVAVQRRLNDTYVGKDTQVIEENIIAMLKEMLEAVKKAQQDQQQQKDQPPGQPSQPQKPGDKQLIEMLSELKLIRMLQMQVNTKTKGTGEQYQGEQASDPILKSELHQLAERQAKIQEMLQKIASGANQ